MNRKLFLLLPLLILTISPFISVPTYGAANWGISTDKKYEFQLIKFLYAGTDYTKFISPKFNIFVTFTDLNETGYTYNIYNGTNNAFISTNTTNFANYTYENASFIVPTGLPVALPLKYDDYDYLAYIGTVINQSAYLMGDFTSFLNISALDNSTQIEVLSVYNSEKLELKANLYTPKVNESLIDALTYSLGSNNEIPLQIPENLTDFSLNLTIAYDATIGIFEELRIIVNSIATDNFGYTSNFNIDVDFAWNNPAAPPPSTNTSASSNNTNNSNNSNTSSADYSWLAATIAPLMVFAVIVINRKKR